MERTIIYIFGPKRLQDDYQNGKCLPQDTTGWLKIGQTTTSTDEDKWNVAMARIKMISRTGVCEPSQLLDVFEYPKTTKHLDDIIRNELTSGVYNLDCSRRQNELVKEQEYEIKAGREYVYGASRKQVWAAIAVFERDLLIENQGTDNFKNFIECITKNNETAIEDQENNTTTIDNKDIKIYDDIVKDLNNKQIKATHPNNKNYGYIQSNGEISCYSFKFDRRYNQAIIAVETTGGDKSKQNIENYITNNNIRQNVALTTPQQGIKNKDKYSWKLIKQYENYEETDIKNWFIANIIKIYNIFNQNI
jgi:hypothetical protein